MFLTEALTPEIAQLMFRYAIEKPELKTAYAYRILEKSFATLKEDATEAKAAFAALKLLPARFAYRESARDEPGYTIHLTGGLWSRVGSRYGPVPLVGVGSNMVAAGFDFCRNVNSAINHRHIVQSNANDPKRRRTYAPDDPLLKAFVAACPQFQRFDKWETLNALRPKPEKGSLLFESRPA